MKVDSFARELSMAAVMLPSHYLIHRIHLSFLTVLPRVPATLYFIRLRITPYVHGQTRTGGRRRADAECKEFAVDVDATVRGCRLALLDRRRPKSRNLRRLSVHSSATSF